VLAKESFLPQQSTCLVCQQRGELFSTACAFRQGTLTAVRFLDGFAGDIADDLADIFHIIYFF
jgi:hypothetical protein